MTHREHLIDRGYVVIPGAVPPELLAWTREQMQVMLPLQSQVFDTLGVVDGVSKTLEAFSEKILRQLGFCYVRSMGAVFVNKKPFEGKRPWHHDWRWGHLPVSQEREPVQVGVVFYMRPTSRENGCLRVWPGSQMLDWNIHPEPFATVDGEADVPANLGDVVIFDSRLRHATHANETAGHH
jgi:ectoine hydroxylase-related dioxygenase (phytanoyl-CoA dioxygenase family)